MKKPLLIVSALAVLTAAADTDYPIPAEVAAANRAKVTAAGGGKPLAVATVEAISPIKRTPDLYPEDADFTGALRFIAAQGEYEPGSLMLYATEDVERCSAEVEGIPAGWLDIRIVKVWYQMGTAWVGYHEDSTRRIPTPELMLYDEDMVRVDHNEREQFVRMDAKDGAKACYEWISFQGRMADFSTNVGNIDISRIRDAKTLLPFKLQKGAFKQLWVTFRAPESAKAGLYSGKIVFRSGKKRLAEKAVTARVLPFKLPYHAETFHNPDKEFHVQISTMEDVLSYVTCDAYARNLAAHNAVDVGVPALTGYSDAEAKAIVERLKANGLNIKKVRLPGCNMTTSYPPEKDDFRYYDFLDRCELYTNDVARAKRLCGEDVTMWSYGIDEAGPAKIRAQRASWQAVHALGGKTQCAAHMNRYVLFNADIVDHPVQPSPLRKIAVDRVHAMNPDAYVFWYADPHAGPESPAYIRWLYSWKSWQSNYDQIGNYILFRNNWCEWWYPQEPMFRALCWAYPVADGIIDTPAWEAYREAVDDIKYATVMRRLAREAKKSKDVNVSYLGRAALAWIAELDGERSDMKYVRLELVERILKLMKALGKETL